MKKSFFLLTMIAAFFLTHTANAQQSDKAKKALIVYYSYSGNTQEIAKYIQGAVECDIFVITPAEAYPETYQECVQQAREEIEAGVKPLLKGKPEKLDEYDVIFVGSPNWCSTIAPPVASFLSENDLESKTIAPFITHGTGGKANCFTDMKKLAPKSTFLKEFAVAGKNAKEAKADVETWLKEIEMLK